MIRIQPEYLRRVDDAATHVELAVLMQNAVELEHATLPPYLTAIISLKAGKNDEVRQILQSVVKEEMLHMCIACNVLNALGGSPSIDDPRFIPTYPGPLPMGIADSLPIPLEAYGPELVERVFMVIEEPEEALVFPLSDGEEPPPEKQTIGLFYDKVIAKLQQLGDPLPGDPGRQVTLEDFYSPEELFPILTIADATNGLNLIVEQGEGTSTSPLDPEGELAHYYRFQQLAVGRRLVADPSVPPGFSFTGSEIPFDPADVWPLSANTHLADVPTGSTALQLAHRFSFSYSKLLAGLHRTFNGEPAFFAEVLSLMFDVKLVGERLASVPFPGRPGENVGPPFQYTTVYA